MGRKQAASHRIQAIPGDRRDPQGMACLMDAFLDWLTVHNYAERTRITWQHSLRYFAQWCADRDLTRPAWITQPILERYQRQLSLQPGAQGQPLSWRTQVSRLGAIQAFFKWLTKHHYLTANPASELELPRRRHRLPRDVLTAREAEAVLNQCDVTTWLGLRDRAILETFYSTGLRRQELINLHLTDLDAERGTVFVRQGKGGTDRVLPIGDRACAWIERYRREVRPGLAVSPDGGTLFLTCHGERLTPHGLSKLTHQYLLQAGIGKSGSCHVWRHTCATVMLENGADIRYIQQLLGHVSLETTQIYTQVSIRALKAVHSATHPATLHRPEATGLGTEGGQASNDTHDPLAFFTADDDDHSILN